jgi:predicted membrane protein
MGPTSYLLAIAFMTILGCVSFRLVFAIATFTEKRFGGHRESIVAILSILGLTVTMTGQRVETPWLAAMATLLWSWVVLIPFVIVGVVLSKCFTAIILWWQKINGHD